MLLTKHKTQNGSGWAIDGYFLPSGFTLGGLLELSRHVMFDLLKKLSGDPVQGEEAAPIDPQQEVWAAGVTYLRSREARRAESTVADMYDHVYEAARPELFFKSLGWRVMGNHMPIRIRADSHWNVPEPELVLVVNSRSEIVGYCAGNDVSSRDIEGENPLYLPQAKIYNGSCSLGPGIVLSDPYSIRDLRITMSIKRGDVIVFEDEIDMSQMKRSFEELAAYLGRELAFPGGAFLMTGTGIVPEDDFTLEPGDLVGISVGDLVLENEVA